MKTVCTRCKNVIEYTSELPKKCPFCGADYLFSPKTEEDILNDGKRSKIKPTLKDISPASKKRRFMIPLALFTDFLWIAVGLFISLRFYIFPRWTITFLPYLGILLTLSAVFRFIYRAVMGARLKKLIVKNGERSIDNLITLLALKTRTDVLVLFKKTVKWGFLIGYGVKMGTTIYKV